MSGGRRRVDRVGGMLDSWRSSKRLPPRVYLEVRPGGEEAGFVDFVFLRRHTARLARPRPSVCGRLTLVASCFDSRYGGRDGS